MVSGRREIRPLRSGYTTGTCAQAAAKVATMMLVNGKLLKRIQVKTPSGVKLNLPLIGQTIGQGFARCGVVKDAGDDNDVTHGAEVYAEVKAFPGEGVNIKGGVGVGKVTKPGLPIPPGEWAINPVPRKMIVEEVSRHLPPGYGAEVTISVPQGEKLAQKTYNPRLGIVGGLSILGTSGIVEPRSLEAYQTSLSLEIGVARAGGYQRLALCSGYLGERLCRDAWGFSETAIIRVGDFVGFALEECLKKGVSEVLVVGHIGKLAKVAAGLFNTHYKYGDARMETIAASAALCGARPEVVQELLSQDSAEATVAIIERERLEAAFDRIAERTTQRLNQLTGNRLKIECLILDLKGRILGKCLGTRSTS